ncbi:4-hydroxy-tetrahydrodipicolinate reductase [Leucobacter denitrificans]|uniref:4-hydroxy-tetrahydrodipicolinate reductase n=1 Tax=Leucobacter denitrificans TaxID=683042 RepID=A0A7G9S4P4_9MICO|nr:4-hydroxy-tetrahydrodipicolinate reductase [Leucobacter denitrificans]QNN62819.1 4-hydroxy-tetrahydrodipicolinate reductase [Leucobacter denitrificans]
MVSSVAVAGASGRLGSLVCEVVESHPDFELVAKLTSKSGADEGAEADILVDVTSPEVSQEIVERALGRGQQVLIGTSGWSAERIAGLEQTMSQFADQGAIVVPNFSLGSVLGTALAQIAAPYFASIEVIEAHHPKKIDSPSGTAVRTAELMAEAREAANSEPLLAPFTEQRARGELVAGIPVHSLRLTGVVAKQEVRFGGPGEVLCLVHDTHSNDAYVAGIRAALEAVREARGVTVGLDSVLGIGRSE